MKNLSKIIISIGCALALTVAVVAAVVLFTSASETSEHTKGEYFEIKLTTNMQSTELIPGGSFTVEPVITNDATSEMYVFIVVETPSVDSSSIYEYTVGDGWSLVESTAEKAVYAYSTDSVMTTLYLDEFTSALTTKMTMKEISNSDFVGLEDINVTITGYAIGTEDISTTPSEAWTYCKQVGNIE